MADAWGRHFNILPFSEHAGRFAHLTTTEHALMNYEEVKAAITALKSAGKKLSECFPHYVPSPHGHEIDLMDLLGALFTFQPDNVRNQREHVILLLANHSLRSKQDAGIQHSVTFLHDKMLENYKKWCAFLDEEHNLQTSTSIEKLAYPCLYLLIWGEAANLRFMPECLCYIFHYMARELNEAMGMQQHTRISISNNTVGQREFFLLGQQKDFLKTVINPIYNAVSSEAHASKNGRAPHSSWRNYDDMNEFFWSKHCFTQLGWPFQPNNDYLHNVPVEVTKDGPKGGPSPGDETDQDSDGRLLSSQPSFKTLRTFLYREGSRKSQRQTTQDEQNKSKIIRRGKKIGFKVGFVEQRSFWHIFHSFHRLWIAQLLILQVLVTLAFSGGDMPWVLLFNRDIQYRLFYIFVTWAALRAVQALLTIIMQFTLISRNAKLLALRMVLKLLASLAWITIFCIMLARVNEQRVRDKDWSTQANLLLMQFLGTVGIFLLPEILATVVFFMPWLANITERSDLKLFHVLAWWFHTRSYVGRGMHQSLINTLRYTIFWLVILATKICFSYFLQIKPMVEPTRELLALKNVDFTWHQLFMNHNRFVVAVLWAPVILIYLMDTQIWFSIFSAFVGAMVGLFSHIGEIRNLQQFKLRFPFLASAITFNLLPDDKQKPDDSLRFFRDMLKRLKIRYGLDRRFTQVPDPLQAQKFACLWNYIISCFREEDLISNKEEIWLKIPTWEAGDKMVHRWPAVLLSNEVAAALRLAKNSAKKYKEPETSKLWQKITKKGEYMESAVQDAFYSLKELLLEDIWENQDVEHSRPWQKYLDQKIKHIEESCKDNTFLRQYNADEIEGVLSHVLKLLEALLQANMSPEAHQASIIRALLNLIDGFVRDLPKKNPPTGVEESGAAGMLDLPREDPLLGVIRVANLEKKELRSKLMRLQYLIDPKENMANAPKNLEASRRLSFFSNSLFMTMPRSSSVEKMLSFSVLTPYFNEEVMYSIQQLNERNEDGINIRYYLQQIFPDEWTNLEERRSNKEDHRTTQPAIKTQDIERKWASYRGQTLARTVRGMMYYQRALEVLAYLEKTRARPDAATSTKTFHERISPEVKAAALLKFSYVVACQAYEELERTANSKADDIKALMKEYPSLRIAYVSETGRGENKNYYSVLAKYDPLQDAVVNVYKILLPGPFKLGEGKPENQNQGIIFTRGEVLQTIDMNQDNYFEEALKVRNLLQEFNETKDEMKKPRILGIREHVFTGSVSSLASFMSAQETSFVTLSQRVLANPLKIRMHYGHPDMFDRLWFLARGGISKASKTINISEDIYAGFNCTLRAGDVTHHEYIQVGKGRDVGMNQITMFEAKISGGNGEQMMSRDVYRLGHRLDFFRMFSFYYTTVGFYVSTLMVILAAYAFLWGRVYLGLSGIEDALDLGEDTLTNAALTAALNQQLIVQIGVFNSLPMIVENSLEWGFTDAAWHFLLMMLQLCFVFYTYSLATKGHYFGRTLLHGGAIYKSTGRDFVVKRETFVTNYRYHSRSHFVKGVELIILLIIYAKYSHIARNSTVYTLMTLSYWFLALTWILAPFLFNPSVFDWLQTVYDYEHFQTWLWRRGGVATKAEESWEVWWNEEQDHLNNTGIWGRMIEVVLNIRFFLIQYGMVYRLNIAAHNKSLLVYLVSWIYVVVAIVVYMVVARAKERYGAKQHIYYRGIQCFVVLFVALVIVLLVELTSFEFKDLFISILGFLPTGWGLLSMAAVGKPFLEGTAVWGVVVEVARLYDLIIGLIVLAPVAMLSWLPGFQNMQTRILFNQAFSRGLQISRLLSGKKTTYRGSY